MWIEEGLLTASHRLRRSLSNTRHLSSPRSALFIYKEKSENAVFRLCREFLIDIFLWNSVRSYEWLLNIVKFKIAFCAKQKRARDKFYNLFIREIFWYQEKIKCGGIIKFHDHRSFTLSTSAIARTLIAGKVWHFLCLHENWKKYIFHYVFAERSHSNVICDSSLSLYVREMKKKKITHDAIFADQTRWIGSLLFHCSMRLSSCRKNKRGFVHSSISRETLLCDLCELNFIWYHAAVDVRLTKAALMHHCYLLDYIITNWLSRSLDRSWWHFSHFANSTDISTILNEWYSTSFEASSNNNEENSETYQNATLCGCVCCSPVKFRHSDYVGREFGMSSVAR